MTKEDLKTLAQLPKVIAVLRKLAAEATEVEKLLGKLNVPKPVVYAKTPAGKLHEVQRLHAEGRINSREVIEALGTEAMAGMNYPAIDRSEVPTPADLPTPERTEFEAAKEEKRAAQKRILDEEKAAKQAFMSQFAHDGGSDKDEAVRREQLTTLVGS